MRYFIQTIACIMLIGCAAVAVANSMSVPTYHRLQAIEELMAEGDLDQAEARLNAMLADMPSRKEDCAYIHYTVATLHLRKGDYGRARSSFLSANEIGGFPEKTALYVLKTLAGLYMQEEEFESAVFYYEACLSNTSEPDKDVYLGLGTAHYYRKDYTAAIRTLKDAIRLFDTGPDAYSILFTSYYELEQLDDAASVLEQMVRLWPDKQRYWLQLAGLYMEMALYDKSVEIVQSALIRGFEAKDSDLMQYVYALYEEKLPYKAAIVLKQAIDSGIVIGNRKNYELLATLLQEAREREMAISALEKAAEFSMDGKNELCIAQLRFEMEDAYEEVIDYAGRAISKGIEQAGSAHMLMAVSCSELGRIEEAREHLAEAGKYEETKIASFRWLESMRVNENDSPAEND